jgi:hypothetical protein
MQLSRPGGLVFRAGLSIDVPAMYRPVRSPVLTIFWHCSFRHFSSRTALKRCTGNEPSRVLAEIPALKGLAMLIRSEKVGVQGGAASAARTPAIPAASLPTLLLGGLLLLIGP